MDGPLSTQEWLVMMIASLLGATTVLLGAAPMWLLGFPALMALVATIGWIKDRKHFRKEKS